MVVWVHVSNWSFDLPLAMPTTIFGLIMLPLFFFVSGFLSYKDERNIKISLIPKSILNKGIALIIPCLVFFSAYYLTIKHVPLSDLGHAFNRCFPREYWFLIALFNIFVIYYAIQIFSRLTTCKAFVPLIIATSILLLVLRNHIPGMIADKLTLRETALFFIFFATGLICRKYQQGFIKLLHNSAATTICILSLIILVYLGHIDNSGLPYTIRGLGHTRLIAFAAIFLLAKIFLQYNPYLEGKSRLARGMNYIGRHTLDIYVLHYFFIPALLYTTPYLTGYNRIVPQMLAIGIVTLSIIGLSLTVSYFLRMSPAIAKYLFGAKATISK